MKKHVLKLITILSLTLLLTGCGDDAKKDTVKDKEDIKVETQVDETKETNEGNETEVTEPNAVDESKQETDITEETKEEVSKEVPTIEELFEFNSEMENSGDMDMEMDMLIRTSYYEEGVSSNMDLGLSADMNIIYDEDTTKMDGKVFVSLFGMEEEQAMKQYIQKNEDGNLTYSYSPYDDIWTVTKSDAEPEEEPENSSFDLINLVEVVDLFNLTLDSESSEDFYIVSGSVRYSDLIDKVGDTESMSSISDLGVEDIEDLTMNFTYTFNKSDNKFAGIEMEIDTDVINDILSQNSNENEKVYFETFSIKVIANKLGEEDFTVVVPKDIVDSAVNINDYLSSDFDF